MHAHHDHAQLCGSPAQHAFSSNSLVAQLLVDEFFLACDSQTTQPAILKRISGAGRLIVPLPRIRAIPSLRRSPVFGALKFIWNATRGHRLAPWRSEFLRWRVETYSGKSAETLRTRDIFGFMWASKWELLNFLLWTGQVQKEARRRP
jgi:hypothetical protein